MVQILYRSPAFIRRNLFTDSHEQKTAMSTPKATMTTAVMTSASHDSIFVMSGS